MWSAFDGGLRYQEWIGDGLLLHGRLGAAEDRAAEQQGKPADVPEFPRHVSLPAEFFVEVSGNAILPYGLSFGEDSRGS